MKQTDNLSFVENPFSFPGVDKMTATLTANESMFRIEKTVTHIQALHARMQQPVNNYLKTEEELEAEFCFVINSNRASYYDQVRTTDGYINIHDLDETFSGYMEENY